MGSGSGKGTSRSSSASSANTTVNTDNRVYQSDFGAVLAGTGVAGDAVAGAVDIGKDAINLGRDALSAGTENLNIGLDFADRFGSNVVDQLFAFTTDTIDRIGTQATNLAGQSIAGNKQLAVASSESTDDKLVRIGGYAFAAIAAILVLPTFFRR